MTRPLWDGRHAMPRRGQSSPASVDRNGLMMIVLARGGEKKPQDITRAVRRPFGPSSVGARASVARQQLTTGISSEILCGADVVVVVLVARVAAAAAADDDDKAGCSYWVSLSLSLGLRERRRESRCGCGRAEGICSSQNSPLPLSPLCRRRRRRRCRRRVLPPLPARLPLYSPLVLSPAGLTLWRREREREREIEGRRAKQRTAIRASPPGSVGASSFKGLLRSGDPLHCTARPTERVSQAERASGRVGGG